MADLIAKRSTTIESFPIHDTIFSNHRCKPFYTGLRDCALQQPQWPIELPRNDHCNQLLYALNETYFRTNVPRPISTPTAKATTTLFVPTSTSTTSLPSPASTIAVNASECPADKITFTNLFCFSIGACFSLLFYMVCIRVYQRCCYTRPCIGPKTSSGPIISSAFYYVATTPSTPAHITSLGLNMTTTADCNNITATLTSV